MLFLIAEVAEAGVEDYSGYWDGEAILGRHQSIAERINRRVSDDETGRDDDDGDDDGSSGRAGAGVTTVCHGRGTRG